MAIDFDVLGFVYLGVQCFIWVVTSLLAVKVVPKTKEDGTKRKCTSLFGIWFKTMWKMRSVYSAFAVHTFDVTTDLLVIGEWYNEEHGKNGIEVDHVDSRLMAIISICILAFHKIMSSIAVFILTNHNILRAFLQFCDLLVFEEIYVAHKKVIETFKDDDNTDNNKHDIESNIGQYIEAGDSKENNEAEAAQAEAEAGDEAAGILFAKRKLTVDYASPIVIKKDSNKAAIDSTSRFKYIRQLEALYESTPQAVLQLVYLMRTGAITDGGAISIIVILSILQSIVSMTNSMLHADSSYMVRDKFNIYRKKFPPSKEFLGHVLLRLSEIAYRVILLALFWTVVGGTGFGILFGFECLLVVVWIAWKKAFLVVTWESLFLALNQIVVMPPEFILNREQDSYTHGCINGFDMEGCMWCALGSLFCVYCGNIVIPPFRCYLKFFTCNCGNIDKSEFGHLAYTSSRVGLSIIEFLILIIFGIISYNDEKDYNYLFSFDHGIYFLIFCFIFLLIYTQFQILMPDITLPYDIPIRSKWGYAFLGDTIELERLKIPEKLILETKNTIYNANINYWNEGFSDENYARLGPVSRVFIDAGISSREDRNKILYDSEYDVDRSFIQLTQFGNYMINNNDKYQLFMKNNNLEKYSTQLLNEFENLNNNFYKHLSFEIPDCLTPYIFAMANRQYDTAQWLLKHGAYPINVDKINDEFVKYEKLMFEQIIDEKINKERQQRKKEKLQKEFAMQDDFMFYGKIEKTNKTDEEMLDDAEFERKLEMKRKKQIDSFQAPRKLEEYELARWILMQKDRTSIDILQKYRIEFLQQYF